MGKTPPEWVLPWVAAPGAAVYHPYPTFRAPINGHFVGLSLQRWQETEPLAPGVPTAMTACSLRPFVEAGGVQTHANRWLAFPSLPLFAECTGFLYSFVKTQLQ